MKMIKAAAAVIAFSVSTSLWAFMPANGIWQIDSETNGQPGRGFTLDVENEVMFFTYYGYRADGSSLFYVAAGPVVNKTFTGDLLNVQGGTSLGAAYKPAYLATSPGKVTLSFTSGTHGTMTLPGESPKAISKNSFGYANGPDGLLGYWQMNMRLSSEIITVGKLLNTKVGASTTTGNGIVTNSAQNFGCEYQISGLLAGTVLCAEGPIVTYSLVFNFKFSGDHGDGIGMYFTSPTTLSSENESHVLRTATKTGARTGLNDGTVASIQIKSAARPSISSSTPAPNMTTAQAKESSEANPISMPDDPEKAAALAAWAAEVHTLIAPN